MRRWTEEDDELILGMLRQGKTRAEIGKLLGVSRHAISGRVYRVGDEKKITTDTN